jgi:hypothetical protein
MPPKLIPGHSFGRSQRPSECLGLSVSTGALRRRSFRRGFDARSTRATEAQRGDLAGIATILQSSVRVAGTSNIAGKEDASRICVRGA